MNSTTPAPKGADIELRDLLDDDGENRAVRSFLMQYSCDRAVTVDRMREHMSLCGWDGCWPDFVAKASSKEHLTKAGAQIWIRHLFSLESGSSTSTSQGAETQLDFIAENGQSIRYIKNGRRNLAVWDADFPAEGAGLRANLRESLGWAIAASTQGDA